MWYFSSQKKHKHDKMIVSRRRWKMRYFVSQKVNGNVIFTDYWKVLVLIISGMEIRFFKPKGWWKNDIY